MAKKKPGKKPAGLHLVGSGAGFRVQHGRYEIGRLVRARKGRNWVAVTVGGLRVASGTSPREAAEKLLPLVELPEAAQTAA